MGRWLEQYQELHKGQQWASAHDTISMTGVLHLSQTEPSAEVEIGHESRRSGSCFGLLNALIGSFDRRFNLY